MNYRSVLETLKFTIPEQAAFHFSIVSALWLKSAFSNELWWAFCMDRSVGDEYFCSFPTALEAYRSLNASLFLVSWSEDKELLSWYDCAKRKLEKAISFARPGVIQMRGQIALLGDLSFIVCGGGPTPSFKVVKVTRTGEVLPLPRLKTPRQLFGFLFFRESLYVLGGENKTEELFSAETMKIIDGNGHSWRSAGNMIASRSNFSPSGYRERIYMCGGNTTQSEFFDTVTLGFFPLEITLKVVGPACTLVYSERLVVIQSNSVSCFELENLSIISEKRYHPRNIAYAMRPVVADDTYFCSTDGLRQICLYSTKSHKYMGEVSSYFNRTRVVYTYDANFTIVKTIEGRGDNQSSREKF